jgi:hypothetical protein
MIEPEDKLYWRARRHTEAVIADMNGTPMPTDPDERKERKTDRRTLFYKTVAERLKHMLAPYIAAEVERRMEAFYTSMGFTRPALAAAPESIAPPPVESLAAKPPVAPAMTAPAPKPPKASAPPLVPVGSMKCARCSASSPTRMCAPCFEIMDALYALLAKKDGLTTQQIAAERLAAYENYDEEEDAEAAILEDLKLDRERFVKYDGGWHARNTTPGVGEDAPSDEFGGELSEDPSDSYIDTLEYERETHAIKGTGRKPKPATAPETKRAKITSRRSA